MKRHIAHIVLEADTPLKVGSNSSDFIQDSPIQKDWNGLPMILGTSIAGVLRKDFQGNVDDIFGKDNGSKVIISNALLCINNKNEVCEELLLEKTPFLQIFDNLPMREHTAITEKGVAKDHSKFDEEVIYKGTRFKFSIELIEDDKNTFEEILNLLSSPSFRLGGGSTKGFGRFKIVEIKTTDKEYSSSLNHPLVGSEALASPKGGAKAPLPTHAIYTLKIKPDDFFMFGSGFGDSDADMTPVYEQTVNYENEKLSDEMILIPASSIKGALSHRTAFYHNKNMLKEGKDHTKVEDKNDAVVAIFGHKKEEDKDTKTELGSKGKLLISDCFKSKADTKTFDHVSIDRFTGGAIDGALFQEKTIADDREYEIEILLENGIKDEFVDAFESALKDICTGMLSLGGATTKGHGVFSGSLKKDNEYLQEDACDEV